MTALRLVKVRPNGDAYWTCSRWLYRFVVTVLETRPPTSSVSFGFPRPSGRELSVNCQHDWLHSWGPVIRAARLRVLSDVPVYCLSSQVRDQCMLLQNSSELGHLLPLWRWLDARYT